MNSYKRFKTKVIHIGDLPLGGSCPIRVQSMTNTDTLNTQATVKQAIELIESGCEYVRITAPSMKEAENLQNIKKLIKQQGYNTPIIADVHFNPKIAEYCARFVEKVRINPGNYADKKTFKKTEYTNIEYFTELERIAQRITPLINICKEYGTALRIGTNHGSLSDRIINRYGDTPSGMVEGTMEFLRICRDLSFSNIVVSLKASNPIIMIEANKLLVVQMIKEDLCLPIHLGVTEAGMGEDGRIKSSLGIGTLLNEGIGDTIRVSLTENPVSEIPFAKQLVKKYNGKKNYTFFEEYNPVLRSESLKRDANKKSRLQKERPYPFIVARLNQCDKKTLNSILNYNISTSQYERAETSPDAIHLVKGNITQNIDKSIEVIHNIEDFNGKSDAPRLYTIKYDKTNPEQWLIENTVHFGRLFSDKIIDGLYIDVDAEHMPSVLNSIFGIMQASRVRISKTEFISCPTCGRTSFDIESTLKKIKEATGHLQGLKIGVMGCIVNGPGEMADADYGYVGNANGKVNLYKGKIAVKKNISQEDALSELIDLLKKDGKWNEKVSQEL